MLVSFDPTEFVLLPATKDCKETLEPAVQQACQAVLVIGVASIGCLHPSHAQCACISTFFQVMICMFRCMENAPHNMKILAH